MLTNLELGKLCVQVEKHRCTDVLAATQEAKLGRPKSTVKIIISKKKCAKGWDPYLLGPSIFEVIAVRARAALSIGGAFSI